MKKILIQTYSQYYENKITDENFYEWFKNSKVVDSKGQPLVVYHGSRFEFEEFEGDSFFTDDYMNADGYAAGENVYEVYLSIQNPFILDCKGKKWDDIEGGSTQNVVGNVDRNLYDGAIFLNIKDSWIDDVDYQDASVVYVAFNSNQVKSVDNKGTWDKNNRNIYE